MTRILFFILAPLFILLVTAMIGRPPAIAVLWSADTGVVVGYRSDVVNTGFGDADRHRAVVKLNTATERALETYDFPTLDSLQADFPEGKAVPVRLPPGGGHAVLSARVWGSFVRFLPVLVLAGGVLAIALSSYWIRYNPVRLTYFGVGVAFVVVPLFVLGVRWTTGNPPPIAHIVWQTETADIVQADIVSGRQNGVLRHTPDIRVSWQAGMEPVTLSGFYAGGRDKAEAVLRRYRLAETVKVNVSPDGKAYPAIWKFQDVVTFVFCMIAPVLFAIAGWLFLAAFRRSRKPKGAS